MDANDPCEVGQFIEKAFYNLARSRGKSHPSPSDGVAAAVQQLSRYSLFVGLSGGNASLANVRLGPFDNGMTGISVNPVKFPPPIPTSWSYSAAGFLFNEYMAQWDKDSNEDDGIVIVAAVAASANKQQSLEAVELGECKAGALLIWQSGEWVPLGLPSPSSALLWIPEERVAVVACTDHGILAYKKDMGPTTVPSASRNCATPPVVPPMPLNWVEVKLPALQQQQQHQSQLDGALGPQTALILTYRPPKTSQVYCIVCKSSGSWHCAAFACGDGRVRLCRLFYGGSQGMGNGAFVDAFCEGPVLSIASLHLNGETGMVNCVVADALGVILSLSWPLEARKRNVISSDTSFVGYPLMERRGSIPLHSGDIVICATNEDACRDNVSDYLVLGTFLGRVIGLEWQPFVSHNPQSDAMVDCHCSNIRNNYDPMTHWEGIARWGEQGVPGRTAKSPLQPWHPQEELPTPQCRKNSTQPNITKSLQHWQLHVRWEHSLPKPCLKICSIERPGVGLSEILAITEGGGLHILGPPDDVAAASALETIDILLKSQQLAC